MGCRHLRIEDEEIPQVGGEPIHVRRFFCALKESSPTMQMEVYDALFKQGLEDSVLNNLCPVATTGNWADCPFFEATQ